VNDEFTDLPARLTALADAPAPASPFDAARTAAAGRRRMLTRRTTAVGGGGALAVAAVVGIVTAFAPGAPTTAAAASPGSTDPLVKVIDFGWLPDSLPYVSYTTTPDGQGTTAIAQGQLQPGGEPRVDLRLLTGDTPGKAAPGERLIPATLDDGRHGYWVTQAPGSGPLPGFFQLRFPTKYGGWASIDWSVNGDRRNASSIAGAPTAATTAGSEDAGVPPTSVPASAQWQRDMLRMATQVSETAAQVPLPFRLTGLPSDFRPGTAFLWRPGDFSTATPGSFSAELMFYSGKLTASLIVRPHGAIPDTVPQVDPGTECATSAGLDVCVQHSGSSPAFTKIGGAKGLLKLVTLLGPDEKRWTTDVIVP
jgi:hypothetical protein